MELTNGVGPLRQHQGPGEKCGVQNRVGNAPFSYSNMHSFFHMKNISELEVDELYT